METNMPVYDFEEAIEFIFSRCSTNINRDMIQEVLELEEDYMRKVGIIVEEQPE